MMMTSRHIYLCKAIFSLLPHICHLRHLRRRCKIFPRCKKHYKKAKYLQVAPANLHRINGSPATLETLQHSISKYEREKCFVSYFEAHSANMAFWDVPAFVWQACRGEVFG